MRNIRRLFNVIDRSLFTIKGDLDYDRITQAIELLSNEIRDYEWDTENIWYLGDGRECCLSDLIVGAYWHYTEWHGGQYSDTYRTLCALGSIFSPGMSSVEDEEDNPAYEALNNMCN